MPLNVKKLGSMSRLLRRSFRSYFSTFATMIGLGFVGGLFEGVGIASVIPLFYVITGQTIEGTDKISHSILWVLRSIHLPMTPPVLLGFITLLFIGKGFVQFGVRYINAIIVTRFEEKLRRALLERTLRTTWSYLLSQKSGRLESILLYDAERGASTASLLSNIIILCTTFSAYVVVALTISWPITLTTLAIGTLMFFFLKPVFWRIRQLQTQAAQTMKEMTHHVTEHLLSAKSIKAMALEIPVITEANVLFARLRQAKVSTSLYRQATLATIDPIGFLVIAALFLLNWRSPDFSIVSFAVVMYLVQKMFSYIGSLSSQVQALNDAYPYLKAVMSWRKKTRLNREEDEGTQPFVLRRELRLEHVGFAYREDRPILTDLNLSIPRGQLIGLVGPSGVGKTTVVDLILRLFHPQTGRITADDIDIREIAIGDWRRHLAYVPQDGLLLNASIRENIRFYSDASDEEIMQAAHQANIHDVIEALPEGYDTSAGERGVTLSGGQRQRIILARALARHPAILILDEATSAIDTESEKLIHDAITRLRGTTIVIIITHRLSTLNYLDRLVVLEGGAIKEEGTPDELLARSDSYLARLLIHQ